MIIIKVSVIVPVYNGQKYLERAIFSLLNQTLKEIEVIIVNDGSTDTTASIADALAASDKRVRVIHLEKNLGAYEARLRGLESASGEYIASCDADDYYSHNAMEKMYNKAKQSNADIVQGKMICLYADEKSEESCFTKTSHKSLKKSDILKNVLENGNNWSMCGKIIRREVFLECLNEYPRENHWVSTEDLMIFAPIAYYSNLQIFIKDKVYFYDRTSETSSLIMGDLKKDKKKIDDIAEIFLAIRNFLKLKNASKETMINLTSITNFNFLWYFQNLKYQDNLKIEMLSSWINKVGGAVIPESVFENDSLNIKKLSQMFVNVKKNNIKTIAMYSSMLRFGGAERVMALLSFLFTSKNYKIIIFTNEDATEEDYKLPDQVKRIVLPIALGDRFEVWKDSVAKYAIDAVIYHCYWEKYLKCDSLYLKILGVVLIQHIHNIFSETIYAANFVYYKKHFNWFHLADALVSLSECDKTYWQLLGFDNVHYIPNPLTFKIDNSRISKLNGKTVLWLGGFKYAKQELIAMDVFSRVLERVSDARFLIVGSAESKQGTDLVHNRAKELNIYNACEFVGYQTDVMPYILRSDVHIMTSLFEGFPMVLGEVKSCGVPTAMFDLPYLEMTKDGLGLVKVPQGDVEALADAIIKILNDSEYKKQLGREAVQSLQPFIDYDTLSAWELVFESINNPPPQQSAYENVVFIVEELVCAAVALNEKYLILDLENNDIQDKFNLFLEVHNNNVKLFYNSLLPYFFSIIRDSRYLTIRIFGIKITIRNKNSDSRMFVITSSQILRFLFSISIEDKRYIVLRLLGFKISIKREC